LGGSSFAQILNKIGNSSEYSGYHISREAFNVFQDLIEADEIQARHDIGSGGL
jgi:phosphoribosylformylglycinamidine synthase